MPHRVSDLAEGYIIYWKHNTQINFTSQNIAIAIYSSIPLPVLCLSPADLDNTTLGIPHDQEKMCGLKAVQHCFSLQNTFVSFYTLSWAEPWVHSPHSNLINLQLSHSTVVHLKQNTLSGPFWVKAKVSFLASGHTLGFMSKSPLQIILLSQGFIHWVTLHP